MQQRATARPPERCKKKEEKRRHREREVCGNAGIVERAAPLHPQNGGGTLKWFEVEMDKMPILQNDAAYTKLKGH